MKVSFSKGNQMTELDLLLIRQREHQRRVYELRIQECTMLGISPHDSLLMKLRGIDEEVRHHMRQIESNGTDYFTASAEMARIRAEVRGEK